MKYLDRDVNASINILIRGGGSAPLQPKMMCDVCEHVSGMMYIPTESLVVMNEHGELTT